MPSSQRTNREWKLRGGNGSRRSFLLICTLLSLLPPLGWAQTSLNVADYGAKADAVQFRVNTVSNSVVVTTTNRFSSADIGKTIELFGVGQQAVGINSYGVNATNNWDIIATITNVVNATNLYLSAPCRISRTNVQATCGTDNTPAIRAAIAAAGNNAIINFPNGVLLCMPTFFTGGNGYAMASILISRGGLHFKGGTNTTLLSRGAFSAVDFSVYGWGIHPYRGYLIQLVAPIANDLPVIFENLTLDGGVLQGNLDVHGIYVNEVDGLGWDVGHSAYLTYDRGNNSGTATHQIFTNVVVQHWRGEMLKSIDGNKNGNVSIYNSTFRDGCATALNIYGSWDVTGNRFENLFQVAEYFQNYYTNTSYFRQNFVTNITGNGWAWNGGIWAAPPFIMQSNIFYLSGIGQNGIQTMPGANISILDNEIHCADYMTVFSIGGTGAQGTQINSNIVIAGNSIYAPAKLGTIFGFGGDGINAVSSLTICSNRVTVPEQIFYVINGGPCQTNVAFSNNIIACSMTAFSTAASPSPFVLIESNNLYSATKTYLDHVTTNSVSYGSGPKQFMDYVATSNLFVLKDSEAPQIPANAYFEFDNRSNKWAYYHGGAGGGIGNGAGGDILIRPSESSAATITLPFGQAMMFYWNGSAWQTNASTKKRLLAPPANFRTN
jgi:hypothetical protein